MEMSYSNFLIDHKLYGEYKLIGLFDRTGEFIYDNFYDVRKISYKPNSRVSTFLNYYMLGTGQLVKDLMEALELDMKILNRRICTLSDGEKIKVFTIKLLISSAKLIVLEHIDAYLNPRDLKVLLKTIKNYMRKLEKNVIFSSVKIDNIVDNADIYVVAENSKIIYKGNDLDTMPEKTSTVKFVDIANGKKAGLIYYKDAKDLLKAIYRSVKK